MSVNILLEAETPNACVNDLKNNSALPELTCSLSIDSAKNTVPSTTAGKKASGSKATVVVPS